MDFIKLAVHKPVTTVMLMLLIVILGLTSLSRLPIDLLPALEIPVAVVSVTYSGVGPEEMEKVITAPLEEALGTVANIKNVSSRTSEGSSLVIAEFNFGTDMNFAALEMREKVDLAKRFFPADASAPMVMRVDPNALPILQLSLTGSQDVLEQQAFAEDILKPRLERLEGVASVSVSGGLEQYITVDVRLERLAGYGITIDYLAQILAAENLNLPAGSVWRGQQQLTVRTIGEFSSVEEIRELPIPMATGGIVTLGELAEVSIALRDVTSLGRLNGQRSVGVSIQKQSGTNTVRAANLARIEIAAVQDEYPELTVHTVFDQSLFIRQAISNLVDKAVVGSALAMLILFLFFRSVPSTLIIGTSIPVSIIATFILIYYNGITLNIMTLGGFALGVGMLVDNSIVVLENIYRFMEDGKSRVDAAILGTKEVAMSITAATLTTVAVFLPIVFVEGLTAMLFKELALTTSMSLMVSLVVSLTLVPMLASKLLRIRKSQVVVSAGGIRGLAGGLGAVFDAFFVRMLASYKGLLRLSLQRRGVTMLIGMTVFAVSMASIWSLGSEFIPAMDEGQISVNVSLPAGSSLGETDNVMAEIEDMLVSLSEVLAVRSTVGSSGGFGFGASRANRGSIEVQLVGRDERQRSTPEVADQVRAFTSHIPGAEIGVEVASTTMMSGGLGGAAISVTLKGREVDVLNEWSELLVATIQSVEGTREVRSNVAVGVPEVQIVVNRTQASQYGLTAAQVAQSVRTTLSGRVATRYKLDGREIDVILRGDHRFRDELALLEMTMISTPMGISVPLSQIASIGIEQGPFTINRDGQARTVTINSEVFGRDVGSVAEDVNVALALLELPAGYNYEMGGQNQELQEAYDDLILALILAVVLVYVILAAQFEALLQPFTIITAVPLSFSGAALALFIARRPLSVPALIGAIILAGIVVNDAILLIDYIDTRRRMGESRTEAIINAGPIRLRPIVITTLTTVLGLVPMALGFGEGGEALAPMATAVIGGLSASTLLTLVLVPTIYTLFDDLGLWITHRMSARHVSPAGGVEDGV
ncbi:MAG TPA: efflux RND transporter permease subunit [Bacillota bacterium]|nr:efflux RND transporter permease subunit [Bacillota bacterium]